VSAAPLIAATAAAMAVLALGEGTGRRGVVLTAKPVASLAFLVLGVSRWSAGDSYGAWLILGLALSVAGDLLLMWPRAFLPGLVSFLLAHAAYLVAFHTLLRASRWPLFLATPVVIASAVVARWLWPHLGMMRAPVLAYVTVISLMVWGALACTLAAGRSPFILTGALLFYLSDLAVARDRFVARGFVNRAWGLPAYYAGQVLLALSIGGAV
jgi:uncharacterized membrane protein YhhN